eukprot:jgi/Astpho2/8299/Aster-x1507
MDPVQQSPLAACTDADFLELIASIPSGGMPFKIPRCVSSTESRVTRQLAWPMACPLSFVPLTDPVVLVETGDVYDRQTLSQWLRKHDDCPLTGVKLKSKRTKADKDMKERVEAWQRDHRERGPRSSKGPRSSRELVRISMMGRSASLSSATRQSDFVVSDMPEQQESGHKMSFGRKAMSSLMPKLSR